MNRLIKDFWNLPMAAWAVVSIVALIVIAGTL